MGPHNRVTEIPGNGPSFCFKYPWAKLFSVKSWRHRTSFFDATPVGRILNRFSSDLYTVDDSLPFILNIFLARLFAVFGVLVICVYSVPWIVLLLVPLGFVYYDVQE